MFNALYDVDMEYILFRLDFLDQYGAFNGMFKTN